VPKLHRVHPPGEPGFPSPRAAAAGDPACQAELLLARSGYPVLDRVRCDYNDGVLLMRGQVPSYYLKQIAQETVADLDGVQLVRNELEVAVSVTETPDGTTPPVAMPELPFDTTLTR
jgi:hypothetical protein